MLERSPYSDFVFLDAMLKQGYVHKRCEFLPAKGTCLAIISQKSGSLLSFKKETKKLCLEGGIPLNVQCSYVAGQSQSGLSGSERTKDKVHVSFVRKNPFSLQRESDPGANHLGSPHWRYLECCGWSSQQSG